MVPAAIAGYDVKAILNRGLGALHANARTTNVGDADGVRFGADDRRARAKAGRDKLTIVTHPEVAAFGTWAEQLIAESTGKHGNGIVPIEGETLGAPASTATTASSSTSAAVSTPKNTSKIKWTATRSRRGSNCSRRPATRSSVSR